MRCTIFLCVIFIINEFPRCVCRSSDDYDDYITYSNGAYDTNYERVISNNDGVKVIPVPQISYQEEDFKVPVVSYDAEAVTVPSERQGIKIYPDNVYGINDYPFDDYDLQPITLPYKKERGQIVIDSSQIQQASYVVEAITSVKGEFLQNPQWSSEENVLYLTDQYEQIIYRYSPKEDDLSSRKIYYGPTAAVFPVKDTPGIILVTVRSELFLLKWGAPGDDLALRQVSVVDIGLPNNMISAGKVDTDGRLWFGTQGTNTVTAAGSFIPDKATLYSVSYENIQNPDIKIRPVTEITGVTWTLDNEKLIYSEAYTKQIIQYDFIAESGTIGNRSVVFDFKKQNIAGLPQGLTLDVDGNIWAGTYNGSEVLKINPKTGELLDKILLPVDQVNALTWGGKDYKTLYVATGREGVENPLPLSGILFAITNTGTKGLIDYGFIFPDADSY